MSKYPTGVWVVSVAELIALIGPGGQAIYVNPAAIISLREPYMIAGESHVVKGTKCVVTMENGTLVASTEPCEVVLRRLTR
jgi:hypothetical protein